MNRRKFINPLRSKKTRLARPSWVNGLDGTSSGSGSYDESGLGHTGVVETHKSTDTELSAINPGKSGPEAPDKLGPWRGRILAFQDDDLFREYMSILEENRKELFPNEDLEG